MKIASTTSSFRNYVGNYDAAGAVRHMAKCGFRHIDVALDLAFMDEDSPLRSDRWQEWAAGIRQAGAECGVDFVQAHASDGAFNDGPEREWRNEMLKRQLHVCKLLGIPGMVVHAIYHPGGTRKEFMEANTRFYRELLPEAEATGVKIYTENTCRQNCPSYFLFEGADLTELRARLDNHPLFGFCWDVGHANCHGVEQYGAILEMGEGLMALHVHDTFSFFGFDSHSAPYAGNTCYDAVINGLLDIGYKGYFTLEAFSVPVAQDFCNCRRPHFLLKGPGFDRLGMLPLEFKLRSETLMLDVVRHMLKTYDCLEE